jgi:ATP phosphoribosyltransferase regulatory subunit
MTDAFAPLRALLADAGYRFVEPPILHDARIFVELAGEDLRRRLFLTGAADGSELALRPDYTIPIALHHLAAGRAGRRGDYAYLGPVFRQRPGGKGEFLQAGIESLGRGDEAAADADMLRLALRAAEVLGVAAPAVRIGDSGLFAAVLAALDLADAWRRRLSRSFGDRPRLDMLVGKLGGTEGPATHEGFLAALDGADHDAAHRVVADLLALAGIKPVGGRSPGEIADRFLEKAALAARMAENRRAPAILRQFLAIGGTAAAAIAALRALARAERLDIGKAIDAFERRADGFAGHGIDPGRIGFAAGFGRRLDYYTGFVFEIHAGNGPEQLVGGGRYDRLLALIGDGNPVPAIGFAIWLDRVAARPADRPAPAAADGLPALPAETGAGTASRPSSPSRRRSRPRRSAGDTAPPGDSEPGGRS